MGKSTLFSAMGATLYGIALIAMDILLASRFGTGGQAAVYQAAYQVPAALIGVLSGGAILGPLIPLLYRHGLREHNSDAQELLRRVVGFVLAIIAAVLFLCWLVAPEVASLIASGFPPPLRFEVITAQRWMLAMLLLHALASLATAALLALDRVMLANLAPALVPLSGMATYPFWDDDAAAIWIAWGYVAGMALSAVLLVIHLRILGYRIVPPGWSGREGVRAFSSAFSTAVVAHAALSMVLVVNVSIAGALSERELTVFGYGSKLVLLALAFLTTLVNSVGLPYFSEVVRGGMDTGLWLRIRRIISRAFLVGGFVALIWAVMAHWVIDVVYARGQFSAVDVNAAAEVQRWFVLQMPFYLIGVICWRALNAVLAWQPLVWASIVALGADILIASYGSALFLATGVAVAHSIAIGLWSLLLLFALRRRLIASSAP